MKYVDMRNGQSAQRPLEIGDDGSSREQIPVLVENPALRGKHHRISWHIGDRPAQYLFRAIGLGGIEEIDAKIQRRAYQRDGFGLVLARGKSETTVAAAAQAGDRDA